MYGSNVIVWHAWISKKSVSFGRFGRYSELFVVSNSNSHRLTLPRRFPLNICFVIWEYFKRFIYIGLCGMLLKNTGAKLFNSSKLFIWSFSFSSSIAITCHTTEKIWREKGILSVMRGACYCSIPFIPKREKKINSTNDTNACFVLFSLFGLHAKYNSKAWLKTDADAILAWKGQNSSYSMHLHDISMLLCMVCLLFCIPFVLMGFANSVLWTTTASAAVEYMTPYIVLYNV